MKVAITLLAAMSVLLACNPSRRLQVAEAKLAECAAQHGRDSLACRAQRIEANEARDDYRSSNETVGGMLENLTEEANDAID